MIRQFQFLFIFVFSLAIAPVAAISAEEPPAIKAWLDSVERQSIANGGGGRPTYASVTPDGDGGGVLNDVKMELKNNETTVAIAIAEMTFSGVQQLDNGQYSFANLAFKNATMTMNARDAGKMVFTIPTVTTKNFVMLPATAADGMDYSQFLGSAVYESAHVPSVTLSVAGQKFEGNDIRASWSGDANTGFGKWAFSMASMVLPVSMVPDAKAREEIQSELGLDKLDLSFDGNAAITGKDKKLDLAYAFRFTGKKIGALEIAFAAKDIPVALSEVLKKVNAGGKPNMGKMMPLLVGIKLAKLKIRFVDDNFVAKALKFAAKKQGTTVEAMTANGAAIIQIGLAQIRAPEFTKSVVAAFQGFVADPKNISIEASPENPVALATLMGMMAAPAAAIKALGVNVLSNQ